MKYEARNTKHETNGNRKKARSGEIRFGPLFFCSNYRLELFLSFVMITGEKRFYSALHRERNMLGSLRRFVFAAACIVLFAAPIRSEDDPEKDPRPVLDRISSYLPRVAPLKITDGRLGIDQESWKKFPSRTRVTKMPPDGKWTRKLPPLDISFTRCWMRWAIMTGVAAAMVAPFSSGPKQPKFKWSLHDQLER